MKGRMFPGLPLVAPAVFPLCRLQGTAKKGRCRQGKHSPVFRFSFWVSSLSAVVLGLFLLLQAENLNAESDVGETPSVIPFEEEDETRFHQKGAQVLGVFTLVILFGYGYAHWQRRKGNSPDSSIRLIAVKSVGQKEKIAVLDVLGEPMVLGVTANRISLLRGGDGTISQERSKKDSDK